MQHAHQLAGRYRISLDRAADQTFVGRCVELPGATARGLHVDAVVKAVRAAAAAELMALPSKGLRAPMPLRDIEGRLGAWMTDLELISEMTMAAPAGVDKPLPSALHAIAQWTIDRYRIVLEGDEHEGYVATSPELPEAVGQGQTAMRAAVDLRWQLEERAFAILSANRMPPEALQDIEARRGHAGMRIARAA
jgi:predicted RNase H-like HicB family nuclease